MTSAEPDWVQWYYDHEAELDEAIASMACGDDLQIFGLRLLAWLLRPVSGEWRIVELVGDKLLLWAQGLRRAQGWRPAAEPDYYVLLFQTIQAMEEERQ